MDGFGDGVRLRRLRTGLTQEELAERAGVSVRGLRKLEVGEITRPRPRTVRALAAALGVGPAGWAAFRVGAHPGSADAAPFRWPPPAAARGEPALGVPRAGPDRAGRRAAGRIAVRRAGRGGHRPAGRGAVPLAAVRPPRPRRARRCGDAGQVRPLLPGAPGAAVLVTGAAGPAADMGAAAVAAGAAVGVGGECGG
ncbi:helix-turn-helix transcriptional regulator [Pseudonocardia sp. S2-4]|uniref:Helix-turn-helix transcriptional regulator n=1 Tax=Pseudonocardia humida TaxID=2800819 RepID=A0ABT0ZW85_9PSEU|nr:helix-turn-helix transcriptional regulator [Pseudonocardia humida]